MPVYTTYYVVLVMRDGSKQREIRSPGTSDEDDARKELDTVREAMKAGEWVDLPWFSARADAIEAAYIDSASFGSF
jgi:hypothetical protein